ncbi:hypothetical protein [Aquicella lusitana]|uniref:Uncharacterized protein n=1 Tax=Aquicella lusitana TaxID=254246 RepID=A0A370GFL4_9COXI|nr:hypothetical protein [Aquicella lusitana]RDI42605.1 hypothetical protein C8D86_11476 [Aquicella lusitana]VVC74383.1 hypothetical protein AQULUS_21490 [Aquicella lusitana]
MKTPAGKIALLFSLMMMHPICLAEPSDWNTYANSLQNCTPSTHEITGANLGGITITYKILGFDAAGNCQVTFTQQAPGGTTSSVSRICTYSRENLPVVVTYMKGIASGNYATDENTKRIVAGACKEMK